MASRIPLRRTGLTIFGSRILSIFSGMLFLVMITGWLNPANFGQWEVILTFVAFASYPAGWLGFWATRDVARGKMVARTVIALNLALSVIGAAAYLVIVSFWSSFTGSNFSPFLLALLLVPLGYFSQAANSVVSGHRPAALGYSLLLSEVAKLAVAYVALFVLKLGLSGVILAMVTSYLTQGVANAFFIRDTLGGGIDLGSGRRWFHDSWVPIIYALGAEISVADTVVASAVAGYVLAGYYQAAFQVGSLVNYAGYLSYAIYPFLLGGGSEDATDRTFDLMLLFGIPMAVGVIVLSPQLLGILSSAYVSPGANVSLALGVLGLAGLASAVSGFFDSIIIAKERADIEETRTFQRYLSSGFAYVSKINISYAITYIVSVFLAVDVGTMDGVGIPTIVLAWATSQLALLGLVSAIKLRRVRKVAKLSVPRAAARYLAVAVAMSAFLYFVSAAFPVGGLDRFESGVRVAALAVAGGAVYFGILSIVDRNFRVLASSILKRRPSEPNRQS